MTQITEATLKNFQKISYAKIIPSGNLVILAGRNAAGKTSALDGVQATLCGHNGREIKRPILDGQGKASVQLDLSDGATLFREYTAAGSKLTGRTATGVKFGQAELNQRVSSLGIDGRAFITLGAKEQLAALLGMVHLDFNPTELEARRQDLYTDRTVVNRCEKELAAQLKSYPDPARGLPAEEISVATLARQLEESRQYDRDLEKRQNEVTRWTEHIQTIEEQINDLQAKLAAAHSNKKIEQLALEEFEDGPIPGDAEIIQEQLDTAEETNTAIRQAAQRKRIAGLLTGASLESNALTQQLEAIEEVKKKGLAAAADQMPIPGLSFDEEGVLFDGVPFSRASGAQQLIVSAAMIIATNPELRVIVIRDGSVLDTDSLARLDAMGDASDFQIFIEVVSDDSGDTEFFFKDGELVA